MVFRRPGVIEQLGRIEHFNIIQCMKVILNYDSDQNYHEIPGTGTWRPKNGTFPGDISLRGGYIEYSVAPRELERYRTHTSCYGSV